MTIVFRVPCPECGIGLKIDERAGGSDLTCPSCLATIPHRLLQADQPPAGTPAEPPTPTTPSPSQTPAGARRRRSRPDEGDWAGYRPEADVQRDSTSAAVLLTVLGLLIIGGIIAYLFGGAGGIARTVSFILAILLFVGIVGGMRSSRNSVLRKTGKALLVVVAIIVLLPVAMILFLFAICAAGGAMSGGLTRH